MIEIIQVVFDWQIIAIMFVFALIEAIWNIALFRYSMSWLPFGLKKFNESFEWTMLQQKPFHYFKGAQTVLSLWLIWIYIQDHLILWQALIMPIIIWLIYYGLGMFTWNYHILLIRPKYWKQEIWKVFPLVIWTKWIKGIEK